MKKVDRLKQYFWKGLYPIWPYFVRWFSFLHKDGRQQYLLGWLPEKYELEDLKKYLSENYNFGNHFVAWHDEGQILSWRKHDGFERQYHLRVFSDGEIRGHYEYTPEHSPLRHFKEIGEEERREEFLNFLGSYVTQEKVTRTISIPKICVREPQITFAMNRS